MLSVNLMRRGHKVQGFLSSKSNNSSFQVIVITHSHPPSRVGVRWLAPALKVYHLPFVTIASSATLPNFLTFLPYFRNIVMRERIELVHGHGSLSSLAHEAILHAHLMGVRTCFTDHSLFGFDDAASILTNKLLVGALLNVDAAICVSYTGFVVTSFTIRRLMWHSRRENTVLRSKMQPHKVYVIPNAIIADRFRPRATPLPTGTSELKFQLAIRVFLILILQSTS
jgi:phosphatidylinositol glycan class A protein